MALDETTKNNDNVRIFGSDFDSVAIAPLGTTMPTGLADLASPWEYAGWLSDDGLHFNPNDSVDTYQAHQGGATVRTHMTTSDTDFEWYADEDKALIHDLQWDVRSRTTSGSGSTLITTTRMKSSRSVKAIALVVDVYDGDIQHRYCIPRYEIGERDNIDMVNDGLTIFHFVGKIIGDVVEITNDQAYDKPVEAATELAA
jgi:hypothetical protein